MTEAMRLFLAAALMSGGAVVLTPAVVGAASVNAILVASRSTGASSPRQGALLTTLNIDLGGIDLVEAAGITFAPPSAGGGGLQPERHRRPRSP